MLYGAKQQQLDHSNVITQYYKQSVLYKETLHYMNTAFTALFSIECMLKIISFGVRVSRSEPQIYYQKPYTEQIFKPFKTFLNLDPWL